MIRERSDIPIIISSARSDISDKAACFKYGADDYLAKPYDSQELVLRINSVLKRGKARVGEKEESKRFLLDEQMREITKEGAVINLTNAEYQILAYLIKRSNFAISREEILLNVESIKYESSYKSIDVLIGRVRSKIEENPKEPQYIKSLRGIGYKLVN
jgi:two-component system OmpR family response regulator